MAAVEKRPVTLGGKGSSLSSADVFHVANDVARVTVDSSAVKRRSSSSNSASKYTFSVPNFFTTEETRASILLLVNKLLLSSSPSAAAQLCGILEQNALKTSDYNVNDVTSDDLSVIEFTAAAVDGISAVIDHCCAGLSAIADAVAAISCEALRVDVSPFNLTDSGDGSCSKDAVAVAADFKVFFNGSKFVNSGNKKVKDCCVAEIPLVHGDFREYTRLLHSRTRVRLSSGFSAGSAHYMSTALLSLAASLSKLGELSVRRAQLIVENSISDKDLSDSLSELFDDQCPRGDSLKELYLSSQAALMKEDYLLFMHKIYELLDMVRKIVSREAVTAFVALEGSQMFVEKIAGDNGSMSEPLSGDIAETDKKGNKKKKVVLGKGTIALMQFIKDKLLNGATTTTSLEKCALDFFALLDPRGLGFDDLLKKVKDIVESNESGRLPKVAKGTRDYAKEMVIRDRAFSIITNVFKRHGAMALDTPVFELRETLMGKYGEDSKLIYHLADQGGELCSLRYDLTVPFARYVAMNGLTSFKRYQIAKVYRRDNPSKGRYREFYQCDFDIAGQSEKMGPDFEVIAILMELLNELNIGDYEVKLNHRKLLDGMLALCGVPQVKFRTICSSIDKLDKKIFDEIKKEMVEVKGLTEETADKIGTFVKHRGSPMELLSELQQEGSEFLSNSESKEALGELEILFKVLEKAKCIDRVVFDLSLARGLDYYTGVIFEAVLKGGDTKVGSIAAGGRYDNLIGLFGSKQVPAVGISLGIERVFEIMKQQETRAIETQVLVSILGNDRKSGNDLQLAGEFVGELSRADIKTEYMINSDVKKQIRRAVDSQIPYMVLVGKQELDEGIVKLKDVKARTEDKVPRNQLVEKLLEMLPRLCDTCSKKCIPGLRS